MHYIVKWGYKGFVTSCMLIEALKKLARLRYINEHPLMNMDIVMCIIFRKNQLIWFKNR